LSDPRADHKVNTRNKLSFGPSQEDEGRKKAVQSMDGGHLTQYTTAQFTLNRYNLLRLPVYLIVYRRLLSISQAARLFARSSVISLVTTN
jgi:hypothetical protein